MWRGKAYGFSLPTPMNVIEPDVTIDVVRDFSNGGSGAGRERGATGSTLAVYIGSPDLWIRWKRKFCNKLTLTRGMPVNKMFENPRVKQLYIFPLCASRNCLNRPFKANEYYAACACRVQFTVNAGWIAKLVQILLGLQCLAIKLDCRRR